MARHVMDTCAWIECVNGSELGHRMARELRRLSDCVVPTIVLLELSKWLGREVDEHQQDAILGRLDECDMVALDRHIALMVSELHGHFKLATADAIIYATARYLGIPLITCDKHFGGLPFVTYYDKRPAAG